MVRARCAEEIRSSQDGSSCVRRVSGQFRGGRRAGTCFRRWARVLWRGRSWDRVAYREDEERYDALEGQRLEDDAELLLVSREAGSRLGLLLGLDCSLPEVLCEPIALVLGLDAEIVYPT